MTDHYPPPQYLPPQVSAPMQPGTVHTTTYQTTVTGSHQPSTTAPVVVINQPSPVVVGGHFSEHPTQMTCPYCHQSMITRVEEEIGGLAVLVTLVACFFIPVFNLVFLCSSCLKDKKHYCSRCNRLVGTKKML